MRETVSTFTNFSVSRSLLCLTIRLQLKEARCVGRYIIVMLHARPAIETHVLHIHTPYEAMLKDGAEKADARNAVQDTVPHSTAIS